MSLSIILVEEINVFWRGILRLNGKMDYDINF